MTPRRLLALLLIAPLLLAISSVARAGNENFDEDGNWIGDIRTYARHCGEVVGAQIPSFNCETQGLQIPVTVNGRIIRAGAPERCDRPAFNAPEKEACQVGSHLGRLTFDDPDIRGVFICRRAPKAQSDGQVYNEIAVILNNQRNGATCWSIAFEFGENASLMKAEVSSPAESETANADGSGEWLNPNQFPCMSCHRPDPFLFTPYVAQVDFAGERLLPGFYEGPDGLNPRFWNPLSPLSDSIRPHRAVFAEGSKASICTSCHAVTAMLVPSSPPFAPFLMESLGIGGEGAMSGDRQAKRSTNPNRAWMHFEHPHLRPPFAFAPSSAGGLNDFGAIGEIFGCVIGGTDDCEREPFRGRPPKAVEFAPEFPPIDVEPGLVNRIAARQRNHDLGEVLKITIRHADGRVSVLGDGVGFDEPVEFVPDCEPGQTVSLRATLIGADGGNIIRNGLAIFAERRLTCVEPTLTRWLDATRTLEAAPDMALSGGVTGPVASFATGGLTVGDRNNREAQRLYLTFPIAPPVKGLKPVSATLTLPFESENGDTRTLGDLRINHYRYGSELTAADFSAQDAFRRGLARVQRAEGVRKVDVSDLVEAAWEAGDGRVQFGIWFANISDGDRTFDLVRLTDAPRARADGRRDFSVLGQPMLTVTFR